MDNEIIKRELLHQKSLTNNSALEQQVVKRQDNVLTIVGTYGHNKISRLGNHLPSLMTHQVGEFALKKGISTAASTVVDDLATLIIKGSRPTISALEAFKSSSIVTSGYILCLAGYNLYRVVGHGRSGKCALKSTVDEGTSVIIANAIGATVLVGLLPFTGGLSALLLGLAAGGVASWAFSPFVESMTKTSLNISNDEYLDKAYKHFGLEEGVNLEKIGRKYRHLSREHHVDRVMGEDLSVIEYHKKMFHKTQYAMVMISSAIEGNEEDYNIARYNFEKMDKEEYGRDLVSEGLNIVKGLFKGIWWFGSTRKDPGILAVMCDQLPYEMFLESEEMQEGGDNGNEEFYEDVNFNKRLTREFECGNESDFEDWEML